MVYPQYKYINWRVAFIGWNLFLVLANTHLGYQSAVNRLENDTLATPRNLANSPPGKQTNKQTSLHLTSEELFRFQRQLAEAVKLGQDLSLEEKIGLLREGTFLRAALQYLLGRRIADSLIETVIANYGLNEQEQTALVLAMAPLSQGGNGSVLLAEAIIKEFKDEKSVNRASADQLWTGFKNVLNQWLGPNGLAEFLKILETDNGAGSIKSKINEILREVHPDKNQNGSVDTSDTSNLFNQATQVAIPLRKRILAEAEAAIKKAREDAKKIAEEKSLWEIGFSKREEGREVVIILGRVGTTFDLATISREQRMAKIVYEGGDPITIQVGNSRLILKESSTVSSTVKGILSVYLLSSEDGWRLYEEGRFYTIGREFSGNNVDIPIQYDDRVSMQHCEIAFKKSVSADGQTAYKVIIRDHSLNGTKIALPRQKTELEKLEEAFSANPSDYGMAWQLAQWYIGKQSDYAKAYPLLVSIADHYQQGLPPVTEIDTEQLRKSLKECDYSLDIASGRDGDFGVGKALGLLRCYQNIQAWDNAELAYEKLWSHAGSFTNAERNRIFSQLIHFYRVSKKYETGYRFLTRTVLESGLIPENIIYTRVQELLDSWWLNSSTDPHQKSTIWIKKGDIYVRQGDMDRAYLNYQTAVKDPASDHDYIEICFKLGDIAQKLGYTAKVKEYYNQAVTRYSNPFARNIRFKELLEQAGLLLRGSIQASVELAEAVIPGSLDVRDIILIDRGLEWRAFKVLRTEGTTVTIEDLTTTETGTLDTIRHKDLSIRRLKGDSWSQLTVNQILQRRFRERFGDIPSNFQLGFIMGGEIRPADLKKGDLVTLENDEVFSFDGTQFQGLQGTPSARKSLTLDSSELKTACLLIPLIEEELRIIEATDLNKEGLIVITKEGQLGKAERNVSGNVTVQFFDGSYSSESIESLRRDYRQVTLTPLVFPTEEMILAKAILLKLSIVEQTRYFKFLSSTPQTQYSPEMAQAHFQLFYKLGNLTRQNPHFLPTHSLQRMTLFKQFMELIAISDPRQEEVILQSL